MSQPSEFTDLIHVLQTSVARFGSRPLFGTKQAGEWHWITFQEFSDRVDAFRGGLAELGIGPDDTVAIISGNRVEWAIAAYATYELGARFCPMYESQLEKDWEYIIKDSGTQVLITSTTPIYETARPWAGKLGALKRVFSMALPADDEASFLALEARGRDHPAPVAEIDPDSICGFIYTSGTTGNPKGVLLSHGNICANLNSAIEILPLYETDTSVSFLPWAHSFGQTAELHLMVSRGAAMAIAESIEKLVENFAEIRPTVLFSVPRIFNRIYDGVHKRMAEEGGVKKVLFDAGMENAERRKQLQAAGQRSSLVELKHKFFNKVVFAKVRARFGGRLRYAISGGAALAPEVAEFIDKLGICVCEGYGLTETSPVVSVNLPDRRKIGTVGPALPGVEVIIDRSVVDDESSDDGEIIVKGGNVMKGYHGLPEETAEVMTADGGFRTGDLGRLDEEGFLIITGRIKEQYKLENGKYVVPAPLEELLQLSPYVAQAFIHGVNKPANVALIVPDRAAIGKWAEEQGLSGEYASTLTHEKTRELMRAQIEEYGKDFKHYEQIRNFELIPEEFTIDNGMLTPKLSVKRKVVMECYEKEIAALHAG